MIPPGENSCEIVLRAGRRACNIGDFFSIRKGRFLGDRHSIRFSNRAPGTDYQFDVTDTEPVREIYSQILTFERDYANKWKNVLIGLRSFVSIYDRVFGEAEDRILDAVTTIEALVGGSPETTFKVAFRVACLFSRDDEERVARFKSTKSHYDTRSRIVHGLALEHKDQVLLSDDSPLLDTVRRLLRGFLILPGTGRYAKPKQFLDEIDSVLLHSVQREELRGAMGFT